MYLILFEARVPTSRIEGWDDSEVGSYACMKVHSCIRTCVPPRTESFNECEFVHTHVRHTLDPDGQPSIYGHSRLRRVFLNSKFPPNPVYQVCGKRTEETWMIPAKAKRGEADGRFLMDYDVLDTDIM